MLTRFNYEGYYGSAQGPLATDHPLRAASLVTQVQALEALQQQNGPESYVPSEVFDLIVENIAGPQEEFAGEGEENYWDKK